jgi:hypothetical protein
MELRGHKKRLHIVLCCIAASVILFFYTPAHAETSTRESAVFCEVTSFVRYMPGRGVHAVSGDVEMVQSVSECNREVTLFDALPVRFSLEIQYTSIDTTTAVELPSHLTGIAAGIEATFPFFEFDKSYLRLGVSPSFYSDDWDLSPSSFRIPERAFLIYQPDGKWTYIAGIAVYPDFENVFLPILGFIYTPHDRLTFNFTPRDPHVSYTLTKRMTLFAEAGRPVNSEFEVTKGAMKNTVLVYNETRLGAGCKYAFNKYIQGALSAGGVFNRSLKYRDDAGKVAIKNGVYSEFKIVIQM